MLGLLFSPHGQFLFQQHPLGTRYLRTSCLPIDEVSTFKHQLKSHLFQSALPSSHPVLAPQIRFTIISWRCMNLCVYELGNSALCIPPPPRHTEIGTVSLPLCAAGISAPNFSHCAVKLEFHGTISREDHRQHVRHARFFFARILARKQVPWNLSLTGFHCFHFLHQSITRLYKYAKICSVF